MQVTKDNLKISTISESKNLGVYSFEPLPQGYGTTLGNSLRRVLLSSVKGAAVTQAKIGGVNHQFTTIPGIKEDVVELTLNLKRIRFKLFTDTPVVVILKKKGAGEVTAGDIETTSDSEIMNKDLHIATLANSKTELNIEMVVESGTGYSPMEERQTTKIGVIILDALFSPITNVIYEAVPTRFGKRADLDKLTLTIETDGSILPKEALNQAAQILKEYYETVVKGGAEETKKAEEEEEKATAGTKETENIAIEELPLQTRTINALKKHGVDTLQQLSEKSDEELADIKNLGEKSLSEIKKLLEKEGLR